MTDYQADLARIEAKLDTIRDTAHAILRTCGAGVVIRPGDRVQHHPTSPIAAKTADWEQRFEAAIGRERARQAETEARLAALEAAAGAARRHCDHLTRRVTDLAATIDNLDTANLRLEARLAAMEASLEMRDAPE